MRVREKRQKSSRRRALLLTPLIDVIFLLALFFVLNTSFRQEQYLDVILPDSESSQDIQAEGIILTLRADGSSTLNGKEVPWESLTSAIEVLISQTAADEVIIRGDENLPYERVVAALDRVRLAGLETISLQTVRRRE